MIEAPYNVILERKGFLKILFVGDIIPTPLAGFGTRVEKIHKQPDEIQRLGRATLRGIRYAKSNKQENVRSIMKWAEMDLELAEGSYDMGRQQLVQYRRGEPTRHSNGHGRNQDRTKTRCLPRSRQGVRLDFCPEAGGKTINCALSLSAATLD